MHRKIVLLVISIFLTGCGAKSYTNISPANMSVEVKTDSGVSSYVDIYDIDSRCHASYSGRADLDSKTKLGVDTDSMKYLEFGFSSSSFLFATSRSMSTSILVKMKKDHSYLVDAFYKNGLYNVKLLEINSSKQQSEVTNAKSGKCRSSDIVFE